jgi:hypothetical protein
MKLRFDKVWRKKKGPAEALLPLNHFPSHLRDSIKHKFRDGNTDLAGIPGKLTSLL